MKLLSRIGQETFYVESVSLANGKGDESVENRLYTREIPRSRCTVSKSTESRNTVVEASSGKCISCIRNESEGDRYKTEDRDNSCPKRERVNEGTVARKRRNEKR